MRSLAQPEVLKRAAAASLVTGAFCYPRLDLWTSRPYPLWFILLTLAWAAFILWSFIFAWHSRYTRCPIFAARPRPALWLLATACGLVGALLLLLFVDPVLRPVAVEEYPTSLPTWAAMTLFVLAFDQLFLCFAPYAFFIRLSGKDAVATSLTVFFGVFLVYLKARSWTPQFSSLFILELFAWRIAAGFASVYFYLRGGAVLTWWWIFLLQLRHLVFLLN